MKKLIFTGITFESYNIEKNIEEIFKSNPLYNSVKNYAMTCISYDGDNHNDDGSWEDYIIYDLWEIPD